MYYFLKMHCIGSHGTKVLVPANALHTQSAFCVSLGLYLRLQQITHSVRFEHSAGNVHRTWVSRTTFWCKRALNTYLSGRWYTPLSYTELKASLLSDTYRCVDNTFTTERGYSFVQPLHNSVDSARIHNTQGSSHYSTHTWLTAREISKNSEEWTSLL